MRKHTYRIQNGSFGICGVRVFRRWGRLTVVLTELRTNPGLSVTNAYEELATDVVQGLTEQGLIDDPRQVRWIEQDEAFPSASGTEETWWEVSLEWDGERFHSPSWRRLDTDRTKLLGFGREIEPHGLTTLEARD